MESTIGTDRSSVGMRQTNMQIEIWNRPPTIETLKNVQVCEDNSNINSYNNSYINNNCEPGQDLKLKLQHNVCAVQQQQQQQQQRHYQQQRWVPDRNVEEKKTITSDTKSHSYHLFHGRNIIFLQLKSCYTDPDRFLGNPTCQGILDPLQYLSILLLETSTYSKTVKTTNGLSIKNKPSLWLKTQIQYEFLLYR